MDSIIKLIIEIVKFAIGLVGFLLVLIFGVFIYHKIATPQDQKEFKNSGELIKVYDDEFMNALEFGTGDKTIVILGDIDILSPYLEFKSLANKLSEKYKVIILETLGHGYSSLSDEERSAKNIVEEIRTVLSFKKYDTKYTLLSSGYSGSYALYYANNYKDEIEGLINLDTMVPLQADYDYSLEKDYPHFYSYYSKTGLSRFLSDIIPDQIKYTSSAAGIKGDDKDEYKYLYSIKSYNDTLINEMNSSYKNLDDLTKIKYDYSLPVLDVISSVTKNNIEKNDKYSLKLIELHNGLYTNTDIQKYIEFDGNHNFYRHNEDKVFAIIDDFMENIK